MSPSSTLLVYGPRYAKSERRGAEADVLQAGPWKEVLVTCHEDDAHIWPYLSFSERQLRKNANNPGDALCNFLFLDFDKSNDHEAILESLLKTPSDHYLRRMAVVYPTLKGMRFVFRLEDPILPGEYGPILRGVALDLARLTGLQVDPTSDEWHRCQRLPKVTRSDGKADGLTWLQPYFFEPLISDSTVTPEELPRWQERLHWDTRGRVVAISTAATPDFATLPPYRATLYKKLLKASRFFSYIFEFVSIPEGRRDSTLMAISAEVVGKCFNGIPESSPDELFQLLCPIVQPMRQDGSETWDSKLWRLIQHCWNGEAQKELDRQKKQEEELTTKDAIIRRMLQALPETSIPNDTNERNAFIERHFCLQTPTGAYVIQKSGDYSLVPLRTSQLPAHFNDGLHCLVDGGFRGSKGALLAGNVILNHFSTNLDDVVYCTGSRPEVKLVIENDKRLLRVVPFALRQDLLDQAEFDKDVGEWLETFRDSALLKRSLAAILAIHRGPTAALYLHGPARVGKSMLALALAECFHCQPVPAANAFSKFNGALLQSPIIMVDEGLPTSIDGMEIADVFRSLVTGSAVSTQRKGQDQINSNIPYRIIFTANSFDMVKKLIGGRTMDAQDRDAFRERILVVETGKKPADWLDSRGASKFTKDWVTGKAKLVKHLLKLYQEFGNQEADGRMLVEGRQHHAFTLSFDLSGYGREVVDCLSSDIAKVKSKGANIAVLQSVLIERGQVWLKKRPYVKYLCERAPVRAEGYSVALDRFLTGETKTHAASMTLLARVDLEKLIFCAQVEGLDTTPLQSCRLEEAGVGP